MKKELDALKFGISKGYSVNQNGTVLSPRGKELKLSKNSSGYLGFTVYYMGRSQTIRVHKFVALMKFGEECFSGHNLVVRHMDNNKLNNSFSNIEIGTPSDNALDIPKERRVAKAILANSKISKEIPRQTMKRNWEKYRDKFIAEISKRRKGKATNFGSNHGRSKLSDEQVNEIRKTHVVTGYNQSNSHELADKFGVNLTTINRIISGKLWKHLKSNKELEAILEGEQ